MEQLLEQLTANLGIVLVVSGAAVIAIAGILVAWLRARSGRDG